MRFCTHDLPENRVWQNSTHDLLIAGTCDDNDKRVVTARWAVIMVIIKHRHGSIVYYVLNNEWIRNRLISWYCWDACIPCCFVHSLMGQVHERRVRWGIHQDTSLSFVTYDTVNQSICVRPEDVERGNKDDTASDTHFGRVKEWWWHVHQCAENRKHALCVANGIANNCRNEENGGELCTWVLLLCEEI